MLYDFVKRYNLVSELVSFATGSICVTRKMKLKSDRLGDFSKENEANGVSNFKHRHD